MIGAVGVQASPARQMRQMTMMKSITMAAALALVLPAGMALSGPIERACVSSDRAKGNRALCSCIQQAANSTLSGSEQRRAAKFFKDPDLAHATWVSQTKSDDAFWERYKSFGQTAEAYCAR